MQWQTADDAERTSGKTLSNYISFMWQGSLIALIILYLAFMDSRNNGILMIPIATLWILSPIIAWYIGRENDNKTYNISPDDENMLRRLARETWGYFDDFVNEENNWLAPDNYQVKPYRGVANRTSPTNIGMGFTSSLAAYDFGYIDMTESVDRISKIMESLESLEKYKGHLYNWYDTLTKAPLMPRYISTVDSGNLAAYMWVLEESLKEYLNSSYLNSSVKKRNM